MISSPGSALSFVETLAAIGVFIASFEAAVNPKQYAEAGLMAWPVSRLRHRILSIGPLATALDTILRYPRILYLQFFRGALAIWLLVPQPWEGLHTAATIGIVLLTVLFNVRSRFGQDGADQMTLHIFFALSLVQLVPTPIVQNAVLWYLTLQSLLSYFSAGVSKAISAEWRSGEALRNILRTRIYGSARLSRWTEPIPHLLTALALFIIGVEVLFPSIPFLPTSLGWACLGLGVIFHGGCAICMGLNTFFWAFLATYPAIAYCCLRP